MTKEDITNTSIKKIKEQTMKIVYQKGMPAKTSLRKLMFEVLPQHEYKIRFSPYFGDHLYSSLLYGAGITQEQILLLIEKLKAEGISVGEHRPYISPTMGSIKILPKQTLTGVI